MSDAILKLEKNLETIRSQQKLMSWEEMKTKVAIEAARLETLRELQPLLDSDLASLQSNLNLHRASPDDVGRLADAFCSLEDLKKSLEGVDFCLGKSNAH